MVETTVQSKSNINTRSLPNYLNFNLFLYHPCTDTKGRMNEVRLHHGNLGSPTVYHYVG